MKVAIAQVNPTVGDLEGNRRLVEEAASRGESANADLVVLPEMVLTGYPPMDLLERDGFVRDQLRELERLLPISNRISTGSVLLSPFNLGGTQRKLLGSLPHEVPPWPGNATDSL